MIEPMESATPTQATNTAGAHTQRNTPCRRRSAPFGLGTRRRDVHRAPGGKELKSLVEVSEFEPNRTLALRVVEGTPIHLRITFEATDQGTLMRLRPHGQLTGPLRLAQPLLRHALKRQFAQHCATLTSVLESTPATAPR